MATELPARGIRPIIVGMALLLCCVGPAGCVRSRGAGASSPDGMVTARVPGGPAISLPRYDHVVMVVEENHSFAEILGSADAPYLNALAARGALMTDSHGVTHPSQPNYLALFAGSTFGIASDACPQQLTGPTLASELLAGGMTFTGYSESLPHAGYTGCHTGGGGSSPLYARKHAPWVDFADLPAAVNQPFTSFPTDSTQLPTMAFVVPNQQDDMHTGPVAAADRWLQDNLGAYAQWATTHNSLLIVTWDEDDGSPGNHILTLFVGAHVRAGHYAETITHFDVLRTIEAIFALAYTHDAASATTIADVWQA